MTVSGVCPHSPESVEDHISWMRVALRLAKTAQKKGEVPIGAVVVLDNHIIGTGYNQTITRCDPTAHAEIVAIRSAAETLGNFRLAGAKIYSTIEPCAMCAGAIVQARFETVIYGADDPKAGAAGSVFDVLRSKRLNHRCKVVSGILEAECAEIIKVFFDCKRQTKTKGGVRRSG